MAKITSAYIKNLIEEMSKSDTHSSQCPELYKTDADILADELIQQYEDKQTKRLLDKIRG